MLSVACLLLWLAIHKEFEPLLLMPIGFGALLANMPLAGLMAGPEGACRAGCSITCSRASSWRSSRPLIFLGIGAMTDFGPLIANPQTVLLGAAAQFGIFGDLPRRRRQLGFTPQEAASIGIIGGADGPTVDLPDHEARPAPAGRHRRRGLLLHGAGAAHPAADHAPADHEEGAARSAWKPASTCRAGPDHLPDRGDHPLRLDRPGRHRLIGLLMFGNLLRECGVIERLTRSAQNELINLVTIVLGLVRRRARWTAAELPEHRDPRASWCSAASPSRCRTAGGVLLGKLMARMPGSPVNPLIGAAGVSAVPMAARVAHQRRPGDGSAQLSADARHGAERGRRDRHGHRGGWVAGAAALTG